MKKRILSILLVLVMALSLVPISAFTVSAAINAVWWANPSDPTDFTVEFDPEFVSSNGWCKLFYSNENFHLKNY